MSYSGKKLGPYELGPLLGAGGMGEVYRASDSRLGRTVAIKVLPPSVVATPERLARFEREARAIAALSHPNICAIHDVGREDGIEFLVMEHLEGETLAQRIARGALPINLALRCGVQIAEGLGHAHRAGITHRDLKPGNIMITPTGAKLLDFGLAKMAASQPEPERSNVPTEVSPLTADGTLVGTMQYMSPEQIEGRNPDPRSDLFALGIILYEIVTGERPFDGASSATVIAAILRSEPTPIRTLRPDVPPALERIIATALEKNRDDRWQTAQDVARQLRWLLEAPSGSEQVVVPVRRRRLLWIVPLLIAIGAAGMFAINSFYAVGRSGSGPPTARLHLAIAGTSTPRGGDLNPFALSPDGKAFCFLGSSGGVGALFVRDLDSFESRRLEGTEGATSPFWSPDGKWIAFSARGKMWKIARSGTAPPQLLCDVAVSGAIGTWRDHTILFADGPEGRLGIYRVQDTGGVATQVTAPSPDEWRHSWPHFLPDGEHFVYQSLREKTLDRDVVLATIDGKKRAVLLQSVSQVRSVGQDKLIYVRDGKLLTQHYDLERGALTGDEEAAGENIAYFFASARAEFDAVANGTVIYRTNTEASRIVVVDRTGGKEKIVDDTSGRFFDLNLSPDGKRAAVTIFDRRNGLGDIWIYDLARGVRDRFTADPGMEFAGVWLPDGRSLIHAQNSGGTVPYVVQRTLGGSSVTNLTQRGSFRFPYSVSPDGATLYFVERNAVTRSDIFRFSMRDRNAEPFIKTSFSENEPVASPDGSWLAYTSNAAGTFEIFMQSLDDPQSERRRVSSSGGSSARWCGQDLYYLAGDGRTISVARSESGKWDDAKSEAVLRREEAVDAFAVAPDGNSFVVLESTPGAQDDLFHVILNLH